MPRFNQKGAAHLLLLIAALGLIAFIVISSTTSFKDKLFGTLFPKPASHASETIDSHFASAGMSTPDFYYYDWNVIFRVAALGMAKPNTLDQPAPAPNHNHAWFVAKTKAYQVDTSGYADSNNSMDNKDTIDKIFEKEKPVITDILSRDVNKGGTWIVGNEVTNNSFGIGCEGPDESPDIYAYQFYKYNQLIKGLDPTAKLATAGFLFAGEAATPGIPRYMDAVLNSPEMHGVKPDIYNFHIYGWGDSNTIYNEYINLVNAYRSHVHAIPGEENKPIWLTEFSGWLFTGHNIASEKAFLDYVIPRMVTNNLVDRFFWFDGNDSECGGCLTLTQNGQLTELGTYYRNLATANPASTSTPIPSPSASANPTAASAKFVFEPASLSIQTGQEFSVKLKVQTDTDSANLFSLKLSFPADKLEVVRVDKQQSFVTSWTEENFDNNSGKISLIGGVANPGFKTAGASSLMATIILKGKQPGSALINIDPASEIFRNSDSAHIFSTANSINATVSITQLPTATPIPTPTSTPTTPTPTAAPTAIPTATPIPPVAACNIASAAWKASENPVNEGSIVRIEVKGNDSCSGKEVKVEIKKDNGILPADSVRNNPQAAIFTGNTAILSWIAEYTPNGPFGLGDPPKYYFSATVEGLTSSFKSSDPTLGVKKASTFVKGDANHDGSISLDDLSILLTHYNKRENFPREIDINDDNVINAFDYNGTLQILRSNGVLGR